MATLSAARAIYNGAATAAEILIASPATARPRGRRRAKPQKATRGRPGGHVSGTNPEPSPQDVSPVRRKPALGQQKTPDYRGFSESG